MTDTLLQEAIDAHKAGNRDRAEDIYRLIIASQPDHPDALALLGVLLQEKGSYEESIALIRRAVALDLSSALFRFYLGNALQASGALDEAIDSFRLAITLCPDMPQAFFNMGNAYIPSSKWDPAIECYEKALELFPDFYLAQNNLALALEKKGSLDRAVQELKNLLDKAPKYQEAWINLCRVAELNNDYHLSLQSGLRAVEIDPQDVRARLGVGVALNRLERHGEAIEVYRSALKIDPNRADIWDNVGQSYQLLNKLDEAEHAFKKAIEIAGQTIPDDSVPTVDEHTFGSKHWHLSLLELLKGDLKKGFSRYRSRLVDLNVKRPFPEFQIWRGEPLDGKTILVYDEQGMGDTIMMARYLPLLRDKGAYVKFWVHDNLAPLFEGWSGVDDLIPRSQEVGVFDYFVSTFDLPFVFGTELDTIPSQTPYILPPPYDPAFDLKRDAKPIIGVVWAGAPKHKQDAKRSLPLSLFSKLFDNSHLRFVSFNRDLRAGDAELLAGFDSVQDVGSQLKNFRELALYLAQVDLVISCDTAVAHLAGAMGKKAWVLLPFAPDWRWLVGRTDTPWYPTMRLFRQTKSGDWMSPLDEIRTELKKIF